MTAVILFPNGLPSHRTEDNVDWKIGDVTQLELLQHKVEVVKDVAHFIDYKVESELKFDLLQRCKRHDDEFMMFKEDAWDVSRCQLRVDFQGPTLM